MLKVLTHHVPDGFTTNMVRYPAATLLYMPLLVMALRRRPLGRFWLAALLPASINIVGQTLWAAAPYLIDAGLMGFLLRLSIIWAILAAFWVFPQERALAHRPDFWIGAGLALIGFVTMSWANLAGSASASLAGVLVMLACGLCYGFYGVTVRYVMGSVHPLVVFAVVGLYTSVGMIALAPLGEPRAVLSLSPSMWGLLLFSALVAIALAHGLYYLAMGRIGVAVPSLALAVTPFVSILEAAIFLGERFTAAQWLGGCVLITGATLAMRAQHLLPHPPLADPHETANE